MPPRWACMAKQRTMFKRALVGVLCGGLLAGVIRLAVSGLDEQRTKARSDTYVQQIISLLDLPGTPEFHHRLDKVRAFINDHSIHRTDRAFRENRKKGAFAAGILAHAKGLS